MARVSFRPLAVAALVITCGKPVLASEDRVAHATRGFDWFANASKPVSRAEAIARTRAAILKARGLSKGATWVCSPAGSGQRASCHKG
jgi:hypothetical protein